VDQLPILNSEFIKLISSEDDELSFTPKALNLLYYMLFRTYLTVVNASFRIIKHSKQMSMTARAIVCAIELVVPDSVGHHLVTEVYRVVDLIKN